MTWSARSPVSSLQTATECSWIPRATAGRGAVAGGQHDRGKDRVGLAHLVSDGGAVAARIRGDCPLNRRQGAAVPHHDPWPPASPAAPPFASLSTPARTCPAGLFGQGAGARPAFGMCRAWAREPVQALKQPRAGGARGGPARRRSHGLCPA